MKEPNHCNQTGLNRRQALTAVGSVALSIASGVALAGSGNTGQKQKPIAFKNYATVADIKQDNSLRVGASIQTAGYFKVGDGGGAAYVVEETGKDTQTGNGNIVLGNGLLAVLVSADVVNYKMFGAVSDGRNDDGVQIKATHEYANRLGIPVVNFSGEYWIKETKNIPVQTNVHWGHTIFHIDEKYNAGNPHFLVQSTESSKSINLDTATKARVIAQVKPGIKIIPELAPYKNSLVILTDANDRIGVRSGTRYGGKQSKAREELFFVEEHGRILGDIAWKFNDYTSLVAYPGNQKYLVMEGGTFYLSGESPVTAAKGDYVRLGFSVERSRTIIRNQWVGLEKGNQDVSMKSRGGFYFFTNVYDVTLENVRLIPFEKDRPGQNDVPEGTYGIGGNRVLNATFRNVKAEGSPIHWGVFGTNLYKNFRVEECELNRIDVHFHCWNLYVKDSKIGTNGITITGGGDLFVENTTCHAASFINFRRDYGAKWDGPIRLRNCRHAPGTSGETTLLSFVADNFDYKYPIGYGRSIKVEDMVIDFSSVPNSKSPCWLMKTSDFSQTATGERVFFPQLIEFKNIMVEGREKGVRLLKIANPETLQVARAGSYDNVQVTPNARLIFHNIDLEQPGEQDPDGQKDAHFTLTNAKAKYTDQFAFYPEIQLINCRHFVGYLGSSIAEIGFDNCSVAQLITNTEAGLRGSITFTNCKLVPLGADTKKPFYILNSRLGTSFINCTLFAPRIHNIPRPDLINNFGFIQLNKSLQHYHLNTKLGQDIISYLKNKKVKLAPAFIEKLKSHHELESS